MRMPGRDTDGSLSQQQRTRATRIRRTCVSGARADADHLQRGKSVAVDRLTAVLLGPWIKGMGIDHTVWGTDSVWYGSPQWQIEALRRPEIPKDMQKKRGFAPLAPANGPVKSRILGYNSAGLYHLNLRTGFSTRPGTSNPRSKKRAESSSLEKAFFFRNSAKSVRR
jgi:hypothetical protein